MAPSFLRENAPSWPPFKDRYRKLGEDDEVPLRSKIDIYSANTVSTAPSPYVPSPDVIASAGPSKKTGKKWKKQGWKGGARIAFYSAVTVLLANILLMVICTTTLQWMDGMTMVYIGTCEQTERINNYVHLVVNLLSTGLLAGSNYCMQLLSAPTRADVDRAHARGHWLDIGVPSLRNLRSLSKKKICLWWILAISSIPLHLFYNSVFFSAIATNDYNVLYATENFVTGAAYNRTMFPDTTDLNVTDTQLKIARYNRLENNECIKQYGQDFVTTRKDVVLVVSSVNASTTSSLQKVVANELPTTGFTPIYNAFAWICDDPLTSDKTQEHIKNKYGFVPCSNMVGKLEAMADHWWRSGGHSIEYCLSEPVEPQCHEHFAPSIMAPVLFFNIFKAIVIWYVAFRYQDKPLVTLGDAIESFITQPDPTTKGMCLATANMVDKHWKQGYVPQPLRYEGQSHRWFRAVSRRQWALFFFLFAFVSIAAAIGIGASIVHIIPHTLANAWSLGLGTVRQQNIINNIRIPSLGANAVFVSAIIANTPQALFSFIYLVYNTVFSTMFLNLEWDRFATHPKGRNLRVSDPREPQRSTYFLQVPYRYAVVLLATSGTLHWLVSQSIFLANIMILPLNDVIPSQDEITTCAYSPQAMIFLLVLVFAMLAWMIGMSLRRYSGKMVMVGSCSAAISAACHVEGRNLSERHSMVLNALRWGATDWGVRKTMTSLSAASSVMSTPGTAFGFDDSKPLFKQESRELQTLPIRPLSAGVTLTPSLDRGIGFDVNTQRKAKELAGRFHELGLDRYENDTSYDSSYRRGPEIRYYDTSNDDLNDTEMAFTPGTGQVGHCSFSDGVVGRPVVGRLYA